MKLRAAIFLDRDGVVNEPTIVEGHPCSPMTVDDFRLIDGVVAACEALAAAGFPLIVVTNQPEIARGRLAIATVEEMHALLRAQLPLTDILYCPHDRGDGCDCRKPLPGMLVAASTRHHVQTRRSVMVGDRWTDVDTARAAGCRSVLIGDGYDEPPSEHVPDLQLPSLLDAIGPMLRLLREEPRASRLTS